MHQNMNDKLKNYIFACHFYLYKISFESKCLKKKIGQAKKILHLHYMSEIQIYKTENMR